VKETMALGTKVEELLAKIVSFGAASGNF